MRKVSESANVLLKSGRRGSSAVDLPVEDGHRQERGRDARHLLTDSVKSPTNQSTRELNFFYSHKSASRFADELCSIATADKSRSIGGSPKAFIKVYFY